jgi:hypothetical protein
MQGFFGPGFVLTANHAGKCRGFGGTLRDNSKEDLKMARPRWQPGSEQIAEIDELLKMGVSRLRVAARFQIDRAVAAGSWPCRGG